MIQGPPATTTMTSIWMASAARGLFMAFVYALNSWAVLNAAQLSDGIAAIWSANAILMFAVIGRSFRQALPYYLGAAAASLFANALASFDTATVVMFTIANMSEVAIGSWTIARLRDSSQELYAPTNLLRFVGIAAGITALSASIAVTGVDTGRAEVWLSWFLSDWLGLLLVVPSLLVLRDRFSGFALAKENPKILLNRVAVYVLVLASALLVFGQNHYPLMFAIAVPVLLAVFVAGRIGAVISTAIVALVDIIATLDATGPVIMATTTAEDRMLLLQTFLACQLLISLPVASILEDRASQAANALHREQTLRSEAEKARRQAELANRKLSIAAARDDLTGLFTRTRIIQKLEKLIERHADKDTPLTVAIFDIDHFKMVNDRFGHIAGDEVLRAIGQIARDAMPRRFEIGRIGGEEFMLLLPGQAVETAAGYAEQLRLAVMTLSGQQAQCGVTISVGMTEARMGDTVKTMMRAADLALYAAKSSGRNQLKRAA